MRRWQRRSGLGSGVDLFKCARLEPRNSGSGLRGQHIARVEPPLGPTFACGRRAGSSRGEKADDRADEDERSDVHGGRQRRRAYVLRGGIRCTVVFMTAHGVHADVRYEIPELTFSPTVQAGKCDDRFEFIDRDIPDLGFLFVEILLLERQSCTQTAGAARNEAPGTGLVNRVPSSVCLVPSQKRPPCGTAS